MIRKNLMELKGEEVGKLNVGRGRKGRFFSFSFFRNGRRLVGGGKKILKLTQEKEKMGQIGI